MQGSLSQSSSEGFYPSLGSGSFRQTLELQPPDQSLLSQFGASAGYGPFSLPTPVPLQYPLNGVVPNLNLGQFSPRSPPPEPSPLFPLSPDSPMSSQSPLSFGSPPQMLPFAQTIPFPTYSLPTNPTPFNFSTSQLTSPRLPVNIGGIQQPAQRVPMVIPVLANPNSEFIKANSGLSTQEGKYCKCLLEVEDKGTAYSPYGVCTKSTKAQVHSCSPYYDWSVMDLDMLTAYMSLHKLNTDNIQTREQALQAIANWKQSRGESF